MPIRVVSTAMMAIASFILVCLVVNCVACFVSGNIIGGIIFTISLLISVCLFATIVARLENNRYWFSRLSSAWFRFIAVSQFMWDGFFLLAIIETLQFIIAHNVDIFSSCFPFIHLVYRSVFRLVCSSFAALFACRFSFRYALCFVIFHIVSLDEIGFVLAYRFISHILRISNKCSC